jgi:hypothetical protein
MKDFRQRAFVGLVGLVTAGLISFGCSSSSDNSGTGGGTGTGGSHTGGSTGTGGSAGGSAAVACGPAGTGTTTPPAAATITDFSDAATDATTNKITYGTSSTVQGGIATFQNAASTAGTTTVTGGALTYTATVSAAGTGADMYPYSGFVVYMNGPACVDASTYTGVQFSIKGDVGTCGLVFSFNDAEHGTMSADDPRFVGPSGSYAPQKTLTVTSAATTVMVPFNDPTLANGSPSVATVPVDPKSLTGVQWQLTNPSTATATCMGSITVDDVKFYK